MSPVDRTHEAPLGKGSITPIGSVTDADLARHASWYKRAVASRYRSVMPEEVVTDKGVPHGKTWVSPKIDGQCWFLVLEGGEAMLINPRGRAILGNVPVLKEARAGAAKRAEERTILAGELFVIRKGEKSRVGDVTTLLTQGAEAAVATLCFVAFDVVWGGDALTPVRSEDYGQRLAVLQRLCDGGKRLQAIMTEVVTKAQEVESFFDQWVGGGKAEGLIARNASNTFKIKPSMTIDAAVVGYTTRTDAPEEVRSLLLALMRKDGRFHLIGSVGNLGASAARIALREQIELLHAETKYRHASSNGALYRFVRPELVVEIKVNDLQSTDSSDADIPRMVLDYGAEGWAAVRKMPGVSIIHPVLERIRDDKAVNDVDVRAAQLLERVAIPTMDDPPEAPDLPASTVVRREVWTKTTKGKVAVRKLLAWKTNKDDLDPLFPPFVVHWTDYSPGRKDPIKHTVRPVPTEDALQAVSDELIQANIKRGWKPAP